jgi:lipopolysaccharide export system protein LptA
VRLTIERLRWIVLAAGLLLVVALGVFLGMAKWRRPFDKRSLPQRLANNILQDTKNFTYAPSKGGHTPYEIHADHLVQLKDGRTMLQGVKIELYGENGDRVDRIEGAEFEYNQKIGQARANGPVEITLMRPGVAPAIAPKATPEHALNKESKNNPLVTAAEVVEAGQVRVKTSGLLFDQKSGLASTAERVEFSMAQGRGSALGASYNSSSGVLTLDRSVELVTQRRDQTVSLHAAHAEFERDAKLGHLRSAAVEANNARAEAVLADLSFRDDGTIDRLDASGGFTLSSAAGSRLAAPRAHLDFDPNNQPRRGHLDGGVTLDSRTNLASIERTVHGGAPAAELEFTSEGQLRHAHLEGGVNITSQQQAPGAARDSRSWRSSVADIDFRSSGNGRLEARTIHGSGGVEVMTEGQRGAQTAVVTRLGARQLVGELEPGSVLRTIRGSGAAVFEQRSSSGALQTASGDRIEARLADSTAHTASASSSQPQIESARLDGHIVLVETPASKPGAAAPVPVRATAGRADFEGQGGWLHLTFSPRVQNAGLELTAQKIDFSQTSGEIWAHDNVKATWTASAAGHSSANVSLGGQGPTHAVAREAQFRQATGEIVFRGQARVWQQANSISAPQIVLDRTRRSLTARATATSEPVRAVLTSVEASGAARSRNTPQIIRVRSGDLRYSDGERRALLHAGVLPAVVAETSAATISSSEVEIQLLPAGSHAGHEPGQSQIDRLIARGHVSIASQARRGTGEQLVYTGETGEYVLTGTATEQPRISDPAHGTTTGEAVIFSSRDNSVRVQGGQRATQTQTTAPR